MKNVSEIEKLEKELKKLDKKQEEQDKKFRKRQLEIRQKIKSLIEDETKNKLGEKLYNKVVHVIDEQPHYGIYKHYIGMIKPDTVCSLGFYMCKDTLYVRIDNNAVTCIHLDENGGSLGIRVKPYELFKNGTVTYGDDTSHNRKRAFTIKIASKEDADFIWEVFETRKKQRNTEIDELRDFCISIVK